MRNNPGTSFFRRFLKSRVGKVVTHSGFIALVLGTLTYILLDFSQGPLRMKILNVAQIAEPPYAAFNYYSKLTTGDRQQQFRVANGSADKSMLVVFREGKSIEDQWNFVGSVNRRSVGFFIGDYDHNQNKEIAVFSISGNNIYLNLVEPYGDKSHLVENLRVDTAETSEFSPALWISEVVFADLNRDGFEELLFSLTLDRMQPRKMYAYNIRTGVLKSSPLSGTGLSEMTVTDYDRDGRNEIFCSSIASEIYPDGGIPYPDTCAWYVVLDEELKYKAEPVPMGGKFSQNHFLMLEKEGMPHLYSYSFRDDEAGKYFRWQLIERDFSLVHAEPFPEIPDSIILLRLKSASGRSQVLQENGSNRLFLIHEGEFSHQKNIMNGSNPVPIFNWEGGLPGIEYAYLIQNETQSIAFLDNDARQLGSLELKSHDQDYRICWAGKADGHFQFLMAGYKLQYLVSVTPNPWQYLQYLILIVLIAGFFAFITFIRIIQSQQISRMEILRKEVLESQLKAIRNELDPHFTFNALNTLSGLSLSGDHDGVDRFINHFSRLLRTHLQTSDKVLVPLKEEIEFVTNYVELQRIRFQNCFILHLDIPKTIDLGRLIPKMLIQTHVENAVKHGLRHLRDNHQQDCAGCLAIRASENEKALVIIIEDNGVGRGSSQTSEFESTGKGLLNLDRMIKAVRELYGTRIHQEIEDLHDQDGGHSGTRIVLTIEG